MGMNRRATVALAAGLLAIAGCEHLPSAESLGLPGEVDWSRLGTKVKTPDPTKVSARSLGTAERVESLGRQIIVQNTFTGLDPLFHTVGVKEPMLFHRGPGELFISEGLVGRCKTDAELAAVLCSELGQMKADRQSAQRVGADKDPFPEVGDTKTAAPPQKKPPQPTNDSADARQFARDLMTGAGFDPAELDRVQPLLREVEKNDALRKQMASSAAPPEWRK
jgi:hypothetical protein